MSGASLFPSISGGWECCGVQQSHACSTGTCGFALYLLTWTQERSWRALLCGTLPCRGWEAGTVWILVAEIQPIADNFPMNSNGVCFPNTSTKSLCDVEVDVGTPH